MRMTRITRQQALQVMETVNPLGLTDCNNRLRIFHSANECYETCFKALYCTFPKGFIDIPLFMSRNMNLPLSKCIELCKHKQLAFIPWDVPKKSESKLSHLTYLFLNVTGVPFSHNAFKCAFFELNQMIKSNNSQK